MIVFIVVTVSPKRREVQRITNALRAAVPADIDIAVQPASLGEPFDAIAQIGAKQILVRWLSRGSVAELSKLLDQSKSEIHPMVLVAPVFTKTARTMAQENGFAWLDETGAARIQTEDIIIVLEGTNLASPKLTYHRWGPMVQGVAEAILDGSKPTVEAMAREADISPASAARALRFLTDQGLLAASKSRGPSSGRHLADPGNLLDALTNSVTEPKTSVNVGVLWRDPLLEVKHLGQLIESKGMTWAVTGAITSAFLAPIATQVAPLVIYLDVLNKAGIVAFCKEIGLQPIDGGRLQLRPFPNVVTKHLVRSLPDEDVRSVSIARAYADLRDTGVRGEDAAEGMRHMIIR